MKSESVTKAWEFYRDNCQGFKEPMRKEFRKLDEYVASLESENAKLRELVWDMWFWGYEGYMDSESQYDAGVLYANAKALHELLQESRAKNVKLRELVRKLHDELVSCEENEYVPGGHKFDGDVRELGVEVDA